MHNAYLQLGMDLGVMGLLPFLGLIVVALTSTIRVIRSGEEAGSRSVSLLGWSLLAGMLTFAAGSFSLGNITNRMWYVWLALCIAAADVYAASGAQPRSRVGTRWGPATRLPTGTQMNDHARQ